MTNVANRSRVQAGVPTGGEFAREQRGENDDLQASTSAYPGYTYDIQTILFDANGDPCRVEDSYDPASLAPGEKLCRSVYEVDPDGLSQLVEDFDDVETAQAEVNRRTAAYTTTGVPFWDPETGHAATLVGPERAEKIAEIVNSNGFQHERVDALTDALKFQSVPEYLGMDRDAKGGAMYRWRVTLTNPHNGETLPVEYAANWVTEAPTTRMLMGSLVRQTSVMNKGSKPVDPVLSSPAAVQQFLGEDYDAFVSAFPKMHSHSPQER